LQKEEKSVFEGQWASAKTQYEIDKKEYEKKYGKIENKRKKSKVAKETPAAKSKVAKDTPATKIKTPTKRKATIQSNGKADKEDESDAEKEEEVEEIEQEDEEEEK